MKWIALIPLIVCLTACGCCFNRDVVEYRPVRYTTGVVTTPVYYDPAPAAVIYEDPIDVTTTTIDYY